jgi:hypothetical protein
LAQSQIFWLRIKTPLAFSQIGVIKTANFLSKFRKFAHVFCGIDLSRLRSYPVQFAFFAKEFENLSVLRLRSGFAEMSDIHRTMIVRCSSVVRPFYGRSSSVSERVSGTVCGRVSGSLSERLSGILL